MTNNFVFIFCLLCFINIKSCIGENEFHKLKQIVKTIHDEHDIIDCINIHQQPVFDHPLLKNHKIEMILPQNIKPQSKNTSEEQLFDQIWNEMDECPKGTVPIKRFDEIDEELLLKLKGGSIHPPHEYAAMKTSEGAYYGTKFAATVWNPHVEHNELSLAQAWITSGPEETLNAIKVGWMVFPDRYKDNRTRLYTMVTTDGYKTFCHDQQCSAYIQLSRKIFPGAVLPLVSRYGSRSYDLWIAVYKAKGNWYLQVGEEIVGYWPAKIFPLMKHSANRLEWGGEVVTRRVHGGHHTKTQMGSGHFADEKYLKAALIHNLQVNTGKDHPVFKRPATLSPVVTGKNCYSLLQARFDEKFGDHFFFGGPGYSPKCP